MSTTTLTSPEAVSTTPAAVTPARVARGEWIKLRSVRSTVITLAGGAFATVMFSAIFSATAGSDDGGPGPAANLDDPISLALGAINVTQLIIGIVGVLVVAGEYATGLIRTTLAAVGRRLQVLRAKAIVLAGTVFALMVVTTTAAMLLGQSLYAGDQPTVGPADGDFWISVLGASTYLTGVALMGLALGFVLRSTAGAIGILVATLFIGPTLLGLLPEGITDAVLKFLPSKAGEAMMQVNLGGGDAELLGTAPAYLVLLAWVAALLGAAGWSLRRRDA